MFIKTTTVYQTLSIMENKIKPCKAIGKANGFLGCGKPTLKRYFGLCSGCFFDFLTNDERGKIIYQKSFLPKVNKKTRLNEKAKTSEMKSDLTNWKDELQKRVNKIIRLIDKDLLCLARNQTGQIHAGHVFARGGNQKHYQQTFLKGLFSCLYYTKR